MRSQSTGGGYCWELYKTPTVRTVICKLFLAPFACRPLGQVQVHRALIRMRGIKAVEEGTWHLTLRVSTSLLWDCVSESCCLITIPTFLLSCLCGHFLSNRPFTPGPSVSVLLGAEWETSVDYLLTLLTVCFTNTCILFVNLFSKIKTKVIC